MLRSSTEKVESEVIQKESIGRCNRRGGLGAAERGPLSRLDFPKGT